MKRETRFTLGGAGVVLLLAAVGGYLYVSGASIWPQIVGVVGLAALALSLFAGVDWHKVRRSRSLYYGTSSTVLTVAVVAIVVLVNALAGNHHIRWDLTPEGLFSLSDQTVKVLDNLEADVTAHAFVRQGDPQGERLVDLLREYTYRSDHIRLEVVDPNRQPSLARTYDVSAYNTVVVESGDDRRTVQSFDLFRFDRFSGALEFSGEQAVTRAIIGVTQGRQGAVYLTSGHGERDPKAEYSQVTSFLTGEGYAVETLNIPETGQVPDDAAVVIVAGPTRDFATEEVEAIREYLDAGGQAMFLIDPTLPTVPLDNLKGLLGDWGVSVRTDVIVDPERHYFVDVLSLIPSYQAHDVTEELMEENLGLVLPRTRSLVVEEPEDEEVDVTSTVLLETSGQSWGETTLPLTQEVSLDETDAKGPLTVGVALERSGEEAEQDARLIVIGTSTFASNDAIAFQGNIDFFVNAVNWLAGREELISIRPKIQEFEQAQLSGSTAGVIFYGTVVFVPALFLVGAGVVAWRRRNL